MILMSLDDLRPGMRLGVGMHNREGHMLLGPGVSLTTQYIARLRDLCSSALPTAGLMCAISIRQEAS